ncbi:hypothetical protein HOLleu_16501 [Holothuria leucospilota]|uniref:Uncharacterized protein n=1 Tax=Holothuria leucospilota TaxID=206669 RepID=A0A9Q1C596_HOLLE|nr:hypothetical protein HOLleu_16501 [Holothuria leucospilota]
MCNNYMCIGLLNGDGKFKGADVQRTAKNYPVTMENYQRLHNCVCDHLMEGNVIHVDGCRIEQRLFGLSEKGLPLAFATEYRPN